jgi:hypothetical protein
VWMGVRLWHALCLDKPYLEKSVLVHKKVHKYYGERRHIFIGHWDSRKRSDISGNWVAIRLLQVVSWIEDSVVVVVVCDPGTWMDMF